MHKFIMYRIVSYFIISAILMNQFECSHYRRSKLHRRQNQETVPIPQQMPLQYIPLQQSVAHPMYPPSFAFNGQSTGNEGYSQGQPYLPYAVPSGNVDNVPVLNNNIGLSPGNSEMSPDDAPVLFAKDAVLPFQETGVSSNDISQLENDPEEARAQTFSPFPDTMISPTFTSTRMDEPEPAFSDPGTPISVYPEFIRSYPNRNSMNVGSKRRRKNTREKNDGLLKIFEKQKELLELSAITELTTDKDVTTELYRSSVENDGIEENTTLIPLPEGMQLKTVTKYDDSIIHASVNITSSTQKILYNDNSTEFEKVVEMQMEKKIEDEKGTGKGYEEVRIIEKERVKPMVKSLAKAHRKRRKNHRNRLFTHHRPKRSKLFSNEVPKSRSLYNKLTFRFPSAIKRKEREPNNLMIPSVIRVWNRKFLTENAKQTREDSAYDRKEIDDFMKFFLNVMKKFRRSRANTTSISETFSTKGCKDCNSLKLLPHDRKKINKSMAIPERMNLIMNLNMKWDSKMKNRVDKIVKILKEYNGPTAAFENATSSAELMSEVNTMSPVYVNEKQNSRFLTAVLIFSAMTCLLTVSTLVLPKLSKLIKLYRVKSDIQTHKLYGTHPKNRAKEFESENLFSDNGQGLEWISENGDWMSDRELET